MYLPVISISVLPKAQFTALRTIRIQGLISSFITLSLVVGTLLFFFNLLIGGLKLILSGGNKEKIDDARRHILNAFIGLIVIFLSWTVLSLIEQFFGIDLHTLQIPSAI